jgi:hypothetical protein
MMPTFTAGPNAYPTIVRMTPPRRFATLRMIALIVSASIFALVLAAAIIGLARAANGTAIPTATMHPTQGTATYNDGWVDMGQALLDAQKAPNGPAQVEHCLDTAPRGDALITCIDAIKLH